MPPWKAELDAIVGARHGGQVSGIEARLKALDQRYPNVPDIAFQLAWTNDSLGKPAEAALQYERALALGLEPNDQAAALIGLGNALRLSGHVTRSVEVLESALRQFPEFREIPLYLALAHHDAGEPTAAVRLLIESTLDTTEDPGLLAHQRALRFNLSNLRSSHGQ